MIKNEFHRDLTFFEIAGVALRASFQPAFTTSKPLHLSPKSLETNTLFFTEFDIYVCSSYWIYWSIANPHWKYMADLIPS